MMKKLKNKYGFYGLFAAYIAMAIVFLLTLFQMPKWLETAELHYIADVQEKIHTIIETNVQKDIKTALIELRKEYGFEIALYDNKTVIYQSIEGVNFESLRSILANSAVVYETQGTITGLTKDYHIWYSIYHPDLQVYVNNLFSLQTIFIFVGFLILLTVTILLRRTLHKPLEQVKIAVEKLELYELEDFAVETDDVINQSMQRFAHNLYGKIRAVSREHTELEYALQSERERLQNMITVSRGIIHDLKSPLHQTLVENDYLLKQNKSLSKEAATVAEYNIHRMEETIEQINDVLKLMNSDIKAMTEEMDNFDIIAMYRDIRQSFLLMMEEREVWLNSDIPETLFVYINKVVARLIMHNMLSNAVKYATADTEIYFKIDIIDNQLHLSCTNEATPQNIERIYRNEELFYAIQDNEAQREYVYSTGNGVYLIKELTNIAGGVFEIQTEASLVTINAILPLNHGGDA